MSAASGSRWVGLDALRGASILAMILVNNPGRWGAEWQYAPLRHADWHGCTFTDLVFPTFLFCCGVAIVPALGGKLARGAPPGALVPGLLLRVAKLALLGMFLSAFPLLTFAPDRDLFAPLLGVRVPGVLQRIGVCYGVAALLFLFTSARTQRRVLWACLLLYWPLITLAPVPGFGPPDLSDPMGTLQGYVDRAVFGDHIWVKGKYDPEGLLSTIPALATCLFGVEAGRWMQATPDAAARAAGLMRRGLLLMALGAAWGWLMPVNKYLWTSSYAVWTAGLACAGLGLAVTCFEPPGRQRSAYALQVYGTNALLVFVGSGLVGRLVGSLLTVDVAGGAVPVKAWFFATVLEPLLPAQAASLAFALLWVAAWFVVLRALYRRGVVWRA
ncbi:MAG: acyltransferase family protein [Planctomycetota bacterium]